MGILVDGRWRNDDHQGKAAGGRFVRADARFRNWVTADGRPGPSGEGGFAAAADCYHLYVSYACPWAHRTLIFCALKGLTDIVGVTTVDPLMGENGWELPADPGPVGDVRYLHQIYSAADPHYTRRVTVPVLWDRQRRTIVSNESSEIIRMFNGVYKCGFATAQDAYEDALRALFDALDQLERRLAGSRYLVGGQISEADWCLFTTLVRFDAVYVGHFKCNLRRIADYANLSAYLRDLYQVPGIAETVRMDQIKRHYYASHRSINPTGIVPVGPDLDFTAPHGRETLEPGV